MGDPSTQIMAQWVTEHQIGDNWCLLEDILIVVLKIRLPNFSELRTTELAEDHLVHVRTLLLNKLSESAVDGAVCGFEIDSEEQNYIRAIGDDQSELVNKLKRICPFAFEEVCCKLLEKFGCENIPTKKTRDGGIDFIGTGLDIFPTGINCPRHCKATIIGQAKRYKADLIAEKSLREFVGASLLQRHDLRISKTIYPLSPVVLAFWTTSDFDPSGREFARKAGVWLMDGATIASYLKSWDLEDWIMGLEDDEVYK